MVTSRTTPGAPPAAKPRRDSAATKRRLLAAATDEFASRGIAGARVDRIAVSAQANKRLIYDYFGDKDGLFDAVLDAHREQIIGAVPMHPTDPSAYAGDLFDYVVGHPDLLRLVTWARLEGRLGPVAQARSMQSYRLRLAAIEDAQRHGHVTLRLTPAQILVLIESIAVGWIVTASELLSRSDDDSSDRQALRQIIVDSVRRLTTGD
jgi:AcrR family transcriptional regulator